MIVVSNTTPLRYLIAIRQERLLAELFSKVHIPSAVFEELTSSSTPELVRRHVSSLPAWIEVHGNINELPSLPRLVHRGELEAITLAEGLQADLLLIDEKVGRIAAADRGLRLSGTLGVLEAANSLRLITDFQETLNALVASGFYLKPLLFQELLKRNK